MTDIIDATFEGGVFKPDRQPAITDPSRVRLHVDCVGDDEKSTTQQAWARLERLWQNSSFNSHGDRLSRADLHERR
jgi:predicted DNA-binding antitoxin AbrB/MazE fold protein